MSLSRIAATAALRVVHRPPSSGPTIRRPSGPTAQNAPAALRTEPITNRCLDDANVGGGEDRVDGDGELGVAVADQEPEAPTGVVEVHAEVAGLLGQPGAGGVSGDAEEVHAASDVLDDEEDIQPAQGDGVEVKQVADQDRVRLGPQELGPGWSGPSRRGSMPALWRMVHTVEAPIR